MEYEDIVYMYKDKKNTVFVLMDRQISFRKPLREVFDEVDSDCFMYIERGYVVNIEHIIRLSLIHILKGDDGMHPLLPEGPY